VPDREVRISHVFDAPREAVFEAWTDPDQVALWWAPAELRIPRESIVVEPRVGGRFHLVMVESSGTEWPMRAEILQISPPELIVMRSEPIPEAGIAETVTRVVLELEGSRTRMTITQGPYSDEVYENASAGWQSVLVKLAALLKERSA
jgi:uncharacterized protein YndB with AHSA1/START domain